MNTGSISKFIFAICLAAAALKAASLVFVILVTPPAAVALIIWTRRFGRIIEAARLAIWFFAFIFIFHLFSHSGAELFSLWFLTATREGALKGLFFGAKLIVFALSASIILHTVDPFELIKPIERLTRHLGKFGKQLSYLAIAFSLALRFIPDLVFQASVTKLALSSRGVIFQGGLIRKLRAAVLLVSTAFVGAFKSTESTAMALSVKGYSTRYSRAVLPDLHFSVSGLFVVAFSTAILILGWRY